MAPEPVGGKLMIVCLSGAAFCILAGLGIIPSLELDALVTSSPPVKADQIASGAV
jgi:hypothetical protein